MQIDSTQLISPLEGKIDSIERRRNDSLRRALLATFPLDTVQRSSVPIDPERIADFRSQRKFQYSDHGRQKTLLDDLLYWLDRQLQRFFEWLFGKEVAGEYFQLFLKSLPYIMIFILLLLLIRFFTKSAQPVVFINKKSRGVYTSLEEILMEESDLDALHAQAKADGDYRLALRYGFLSLLKQLRQRGLIEWRAQKTNQDYLKETRGTPIHPLLEGIIRWYEYSWYGAFPVDAEHYQQAIQAMNRLRQIVEQP